MSLGCGLLVITDSRRCSPVGRWRVAAVAVESVLIDSLPLKSVHVLACECCGQFTLVFSSFISTYSVDHDPSYQRRQITCLLQSALLPHEAAACNLKRRLHHRPAFRNQNTLLRSSCFYSNPTTFHLPTFIFPSTSLTLCFGTLL